MQLLRSFRTVLEQKFLYIPTLLHTTAAFFTLSSRCSGFTWLKTVLQDSGLSKFVQIFVFFFQFSISDIVWNIWVFVCRSMWSNTRLHTTISAIERWCNEEMHCKLAKKICVPSSTGFVKYAYLCHFVLNAHFCRKSEFVANRRCLTDFNTSRG